ncbi:MULTISPECIES: hypothetical protein [Kamptonema]|uniref:hypothetical protein n=1 Tax=Kamptonema TaxID=1501433 RepID=UPI0012D84AA2|nr:MULTISPECIES: hypothetical protein [Kamptonema]
MALLEFKGDAWGLRRFRLSASRRTLATPTCLQSDKTIALGMCYFLIVLKSD